MNVPTANVVRRRAAIESVRWPAGDGGIADARDGAECSGALGAAVEMTMDALAQKAGGCGQHLARVESVTKTCPE